MRAAQIRTIGEPPAVAELDEPTSTPGEAAIDIEAVALNPIDLAIAAGRFYGGHPPLPYIPGCEAVGRRRGGGRVYIFGEGLSLKRDGTLAEVVTFPEHAVVPLADDADGAVAVACGIAGLAGWEPVTNSADVGSADTVLVLGATGTAGRIAVQAARLRGAGRIVAAGRRVDALERARELGADETVSLDDDDLAARFKEASGGEGPTVVIDFVWGLPLAAAVRAAAPGARIVNIGQSAGADATLASADVRGKQLRILGYTDFALTPEQLREGHAELVAHATAGRILIDVESFALDRVREAWERQASGAGAKVVVQM